MRITRKQIREIIQEVGIADGVPQSLTSKVYESIVDALEQSAELGGGSLDAPLLVMSVQADHPGLKAEDIHSFLDTMVEDGTLSLDPRTQELSLTR